MNQTADLAPAPEGLTARLSFMMFLQFFVWGAWYVSMTGWINREHLGGLTGWAYTVGPIAALISPFFLGVIADRFFATQKVLGVLHLLGGLCLIAVPPVVASAHTPAPDAEHAAFSHPFVLILLAHMLCYMPTLGLTNSLCFHHLRSPERQFPLIRVFGTIGWIVGNLVVGGNLKPFHIDITWIADGDSSPLQFSVAGGAALLLGVFSFTLPDTPPPQAGKSVSLARIAGVDSLRLFRNPSYAVFILCSFLICIPLAGYYAFARTFAEASGFKDNPTLTMSSGQASEIIFMILMPAFFARLGVKWMLAVGMAAWAVRYGLFAAAAGSEVAGARWLVLAGIVLHGICYDFFFVAGSIYVDRAAPPDIRAQAQGFLVLVTQGLGLGVGAQVFTRWVTRSTHDGVTDWRAVWAAPAVTAAAVMLLFIALFRERAARADARPGPAKT